jgi:hypothetical protein
MSIGDIMEKDKAEKGRDTEWFKNAILESDSVDSFINDVSALNQNKSIQEVLEALITEKALKKTDVISLSGLSHAYVYEIFNGYKIPTREKCIHLIFGMKLNYLEAQRLLRLYRYDELYPKITREAVIIFAINKGFDIIQTDEMLYKLSEDTILNI